MMQSTRAMLTALMICIPVDAIRDQEKSESPSIEKRVVDSAQRPEDAATAIALLKAAIESIRTVQCRTVCSEMLPVKKGGKLLPDGSTILQEFTWDWNAETSQIAISGEKLTPSPDDSEYRYGAFWESCDGKNVKSFEEQVMRGSFMPKEEHMCTNLSVSTLLGMNLGGESYPLRGICNILEGGTLEQDKADPETILLKSPEPAPGQFGSYQFLVWLDPSKGYLPKRFDVVIPDIGVTHYRNDILEFYETPNHVWVPVKLKESMWSTEQVIPPGCTNEQVNSLSLEEFQKLGITYRGKWVRLFHFNRS